MKASILRRGTYDLGGVGLVSDAGVGPVSSLGTAGVDGWLARNPMDHLGTYDLKPWQGNPVQGGTDDYRSNVTPVDSGAASVRFSHLMAAGQLAGPPAGPELISPLQVQLGGFPASTQFGAKTSTTQGVFANDNILAANTGTVAAVSLFYAAFDWPQLQSGWTSQNGFPGVASQANDWLWYDRQPGFPPPFRQASWNALCTGPDIMSALAGSSSVTYDMSALAGGCRFVALFLAGYGAGSILSPVNPVARLSYVVEDVPGPSQYGAITYGFPVRAIQARGAATLEDDPAFTVAQWSLARLGDYPMVAGNGTHGQSCSVNVVNNCDFALNATLNYFCGTSIDRTASPGTAAAVTAVAGGVPATQRAANTRIPPDNGLPAGSVNGPYTYAHLQLAQPAATTPNTFGSTARGCVTVA